MIDNKNKQKNIYPVVIIAILIVAIIFTIILCFPINKQKYDSSYESTNGVITIADWNFEKDNSSQIINLDLSDTVDSKTLTNGFIAPGTKGSFKIIISNTNSKVSVDYKVTIGEIIDGPKGLIIHDATNSTGTLKPNESAIDIIYTWEWSYEGDDIDDMASAGKTLTIPITIEGTQVNPSTK